MQRRHEHAGVSALLLVGVALLLPLLVGQVLQHGGLLKHEGHSLSHEVTRNKEWC